MASEALVAAQIDAGAQLVEALDRDNLEAKAALWLFYPDIERWKLVIAPKNQMKDLQEAYLKVVRAVRNLDSLATEDVKLIQPDDPLLKGLAMIHVGGNSQVRMRRNWLNGVYLEDALVYRSAA